MTLEFHTNWQKILTDSNADPEGWIEFPNGLRQYFLFKNEETGASIAILDFPKGVGIPEKHSHASNQSMICMEGEYHYTDSEIVLTPGSFYSNPKDHPHGPTMAVERSVLIEFYDGPHYYDKPTFHSDDTYKTTLTD